MPQKIGYSSLVDQLDRGHISFGTVAAGTKSVYIDCNGIDRLSVQAVAAAGSTLAATTSVFCSNSYVPHPNDPQNTTIGGTVAPLRAGAFTDITSRVTKSADFAGSAGSQDIDVGFVSQGWIRVDFARTAGSGTLDVYISGKTLGNY